MKEDKIILYQEEGRNIPVNVIFEDETFWLTQKSMAELFDVDRTSITKHLSNIFSEGELEQNSVSEVFSHTASDGKNYNTTYYNLDAIISVGYRVNSDFENLIKKIKK